MPADTRGDRSPETQTVNVDGHRIRLTHLNKVLYPETGWTKADVLAYYAAVAPALIGQARQRPLTRKRWPDGVGTRSDPIKPFFRKALESSAPNWIPRAEQQHSDHTAVYPLLDNDAVLTWLGQVAALELHTPQWRFAQADDVEGRKPLNPDRMVLDLDPGPGAGLAECAHVARLCREIMTGMGLDPVPVTSGSKGIHLYADLTGSSTSEEVKDVAHELASSLSADHPDLVVADMATKLRRGKVFIDWSQNSASKTTVCPYSLRGLPIPTAAAPRTWEELEQSDLAQLSPDEVVQRLRQGIDPLRDASAGSPSAADESAAAAADRLSVYRSKRHHDKTPEPVPDSDAGSGTSEAGSQQTGPQESAGPIFVIQEHHASTLHFDTRLEHDGVLVSWAVPKGPPLRRGLHRLAVQTEDHPMEYASFAGTIPKGQYGAGTVSIWDSGTINVEKWRSDEIIAVLQGRPDGGLGGVPRRYVFIHTHGEDWLMQLMKDQPTNDASTATTNGADAASAAEAGAAEDPADGTGADSASKEGSLPAPMLADPAHPSEHFSGTGRAWEAKWDGYRAIAEIRDDGVEVRSRNGNDITAQFPELAELHHLGKPGTIVDGEIVALDSRSTPNFGKLQHRGGLSSREARRAADTSPVDYMIFDLLALPGRSLLTEPYERRRELLVDNVEQGDNIAIPQDLGRDYWAALSSSRELGLEGVIGKELGSPYRPGRRSRDWVKVKHENHQEAVIIGWRAGKGARESTFGSLLLGIPEDGTLRYAGRVGTGFDEDQLVALHARLAKLQRKTPPVDDVPRADQRDATWVSPKIVAEVRHSGRTRDGRLRHPVWRGLRPDKSPAEVRWE